MWAHPQMKNVRALVPYAAFILIFVFFSLVAFNRFDTLNNFSTIVQQATVLAIVGFGMHRGAVDGVGLCRLFNRATRGDTPPKYLSSDHDRLFQFHRWQANLRVLEVEEIKTVPYAPLSHPFVERLIGTIRRECLDRTLFWTAADLEIKLLEFQRYYNGYRVHAALDGRPPESIPDEGGVHTCLGSYRWQSHCRGLYQTPMAA